MAGRDRKVKDEERGVGCAALSVTLSSAAQQPKGGKDREWEEGAQPRPNTTQRRKEAGGRLYTTGTVAHSKGG